MTNPHLDSVRGRAFVILLVVFMILFSGVAAAASVSVDSGVPFRTDSGLTVTTGIGISQDLSSPFVDSETVELQNTTFSSSTGGNLTVDQYTGSFTKLGDIDANGHNILISPPDKPNATVSGGVTAFEFADPALDDGQTDFVYAASSSGTITLNGLTPGAEIGARSATGDAIDGATVAADGSVTLSVDSRGTADVRLFSNPATPDIDNTAADPTSEVPVDGSIELSIDIDDNDFAADTVTAEFYLDGNSVGTDTLSSAGTANVSTTVTTGGEHNWHVVATDGYGNSIQSDADAAAAGDQDFTFSLPAKLTVRNASDPSQLVDGGSVEVTFFGSQDVVTRQDNDQDGEISFDGLPLNQRFEAELTADNFSSRTVVIQSLFETDEAYMLPQSVKTVRPRFTLDSAVQSFDERESELIIERPVNQSGSLKYAQINEQQFGVSGVDITLQENQRYRLTVRAPNGETRQIGSYRATASEQVTLQIESGSFDAAQSVSGVEFASSFDASGPAVQATVRDANIRSSSVTVTRKNDSTVILDESAAGNISVSAPATNNTQYEVNMTATLDSGETVSTSQRVSGGGIPAATALDSKWQNLLAMAVLIVVAGLFTRANAGIGAISTASVGGILWFVGWLNGVATGLTVVVAMLIGVIAYAKQQRSGVPT
jgi:hypothetical protein